LPITHRIAIGNALIIAVGAVGGNLLTRHLATQAADLWLALPFLSLGITVSVPANLWIVRNALHPLRNQTITVNRVDHHTEQVLTLQHLGLLGIQKRARLAGGKAIIQNTPGKGARNDVLIPHLVNENG
jgi:hypothetical protein